MMKLNSYFENETFAFSKVEIFPTRVVLGNNAPDLHAAVHEVNEDAFYIPNLSA